MLVNRNNYVVVAYYRSSSSESQNRQFNSIPAQKSRIKDWARRFNSKILREFEDRESGKDFNRPEFKKLWAFCRDHKGVITHVICTEVTRFGREGSEFLRWFKKFQAIGIQVNFADEWIDFEVPEMYSLFYYRIGNAEAERLRISKRTRETKAEIRRSGYYADTPPVPWKYAAERNAQGRKPLVPNEPAFSFYKKALKLFASSGLGQVEAISLACGDQFKISPSTFSRILRNPLIAGYIPIWDFSVGKKTERPLLDMVKGHVEPLVDWDAYQRIQEKIRTSSSPKLNQPIVYFREEFPLKKVLFCPKCLIAMTAYNTKGRHGKTYGYYDCPKKHNRINANKAHDLIARALNTFQVRDEEREVVEKASDNAIDILGLSSSKRVEQAQKKLNDTLEKIEKLKNDYLKLDAEVFSEMMSTFKAEAKELSTELEMLKNQRAIGLETKSKLINLLDRLGDWFTDLATPYQQYQLCRMIFPEGFSIENGKVRTPRVNQLLSLICSISGYNTSEKKESGPNGPLIVEAEEEGFEPPVPVKVRRFSRPVH